MKKSWLTCHILKTLCLNHNKMIMLIIFFMSAFTSAQTNQISEDSFGISSSEMVFQSLLAQTERQGSTRVIIEIEMPDTLLPKINFPTSQAHQQTMHAVQQRVMSNIEPMGLSKIKYYKHLPFMAMELDATALTALRNNPDVKAIYEDKLYTTQLVDSTFLIGSTTTCIDGFCGQGQVVAVLDTGVEADHSFLSNVVHEACFSSTVTGNFSTTVCPNGAEEQIAEVGAAAPCTINGCYHGTHVAGIATGNGSAAGVAFSGVAPDADLMAIQVFSKFVDPFCSSIGISSPCLLSYTSDQLSALEHIYDERDNYDIAAVNMSLGGGSFTSSCDSNNPATTAAVDLLKSVGIATVAASGNSGSSTSISSPACISSVISVGATTKSDLVSSFSNSASILDLLAPGQFINSSFPNNQFNLLSGTSMATPHVAGAYAVLRSANPGASVDEILNALKDTGVPILDSRNGLIRSRIQIDLAIDQIAITAPTVNIDNPADGAAFTTLDLIVFNGTANDIEDGDTSTSINWTSDLDGLLGTGASVVSSLNIGVHTITASATDTDSATGIAAITLTVNTPDVTPPIVSDDNAIVDQGATVVIILTANDNDSESGLDLNSLVLSVATNGVLVDNLNGSVDYIHNGSGTINDSFTYTIADNVGNVSSSALVNITVTPPDITLPTVVITAPLDNDTVTGTVSVTAIATDNVAVDRVEFSVDGVLQVTDTTAPYAFLWNTTVTTNNVHSLKAEVYDLSGNASDHIISITVDNSSAPPLAHWTFDEGVGTTAFDSSGNGNDGTVAGATWTAQGQLNGALNFDGSNDFVDVGTWDVTGDEISIAMWFKADGFGTTDARLITKSTNTAEQDHFFMLSTVSSNGIKLRFRLKTDGVTDTLVANASTLNIDQWIHAVAVYDGNQMRLYQDGVEVGNRGKTGILSTDNTVQIRIGQNPNGYGSFDGGIDDVRIYDRALTPAEIQQLASGAPDTTSPVVFSIASSSTENTATINWSTNEPADSQIEYGLSNALGTFSTLDTTLTTNHSVTLTGLQDSSTYFYRIRSQDSTGNLTVSAEQTVITQTPPPPDTTPPTILSIASSSTENTATITWGTDEPADSQIEYGLSNVLGTFSTLDTALTTNHSVTLTGLQDSSTYFYRIRTRDVSDNLALSTEQTVNTQIPPLPDITLPTVVITAPADNDTVAGTVSVTAIATDNVAVDRVEFSVDGVLQVTDTTAPYVFLWNTTVTTDNVHSLKAEVYDLSGNASDHIISITVDNSSAPPLAHWTFDEGVGTTAFDSSGNGNDGTVAGATWTAQGQLNGALNFDGSNDFVDVGTWDVTGDEISIAMWFKADGFGTTDARLITKSTNTAEQDHFFMLSTISSNGMKLRFRLKTNGITHTLVANAGTLSAGVWIHAVAVYDGNQMRLYQDGVEVGSRGKTGVLSTDNTVQIRIGQNPNGYGSFDGDIDDVRIYDRALTPAEIQQLAVGNP